MLLAIPYQSLDVENIHLSLFHQDKYGKTIARLTYKDNSIDFQDVCILTPLLRVIDYQPESSRLRLDVSDNPHFQMKITSLHEYLMSTFFVYQFQFLNQKHKSPEYIRSLFYSLIDGPVLSLYIYPSLQVQYANGMRGSITDIKPNDRIRCIIRFQGILQMIKRENLHLRLHHSVPTLCCTLHFLEKSAQK
jgi:hypothetical protein